MTRRVKDLAARAKAAKEGTAEPQPISGLNTFKPSKGIWKCVRVTDAKVVFAALFGVDSAPVQREDDDPITCGGMWCERPMSAWVQVNMPDATAFIPMCRDHRTALAEKKAEK